MRLTTYLKGHKAPVSPFTLSVYLEEAQRALYPEAQRDADRMWQEYYDAFSAHIPDWCKQGKFLNRGFRPPHVSPLWMHYWKRVNPIDNPLAAAIERTYVERWLFGHPLASLAVGVELMGNLFEHLHFDTAMGVRRMRPEINKVLAEMAGISAQDVAQLFMGKRSAHALLTERIGSYNLRQERALMHGALLFAARYCASPRRTWVQTQAFLESTHDDLLHQIGLDHTNYGPTEMKRVARDFIEVFTK